MSLSSQAVARPGLNLEQRSGALQILAVLLGTLVLALASWIEVPMLPVPMTMQTFAVTTIGALYGARLGSLTVLAWLAQAALGLPVLAGGAGGIAHFAGPTAGYLLAFPLVAWLLGMAADRGWFAGRPLRGLALMLAGNAAILALGAAWLANLIGADKAIAYGVTPFLLGGALKAALSEAVVLATNRFGPPAAMP